MPSAESPRPPLKLQLAMSPTCLEPEQCGDKGVNILTGVVKGQRRANRAFNSHATQDGLSTVVAGSHGDTLVVERDSNIFRANVIENERHHTSLLACCSDQPQAGH